MPDLDVVKHLLDFGSFGLVAWLFWHTFPRLSPALHDRLDRAIERFERALEQQHVECKAILDRQSQKFDQLLADYRAHSRDEIKDLKRAYDRGDA